MHPEVILSRLLCVTLNSCAEFLHSKSPVVAGRAAKYPLGAGQLGQQPAMGRPYEELGGVHEWSDPLGDSGYLARYRLGGETVVILACVTNLRSWIYLDTKIRHLDAKAMCHS